MWLDGALTFNDSYEKEVGSPMSEVRGHYDRALGTQAGFSCVVLMPRIMETHVKRFCFFALKEQAEGSQWQARPRAPPLERIV